MRENELALEQTVEYNANSLSVYQETHDLVVGMSFPFPKEKDKI